MKAVSLDNLKQFKNKLEELFIKRNNAGFANLKQEIICDDNTIVSSSHLYTLTNSYKDFDFLVFNFHNSGSSHKSFILSTLDIQNNEFYVDNWKTFDETHSAGCDFHIKFVSETELLLEVNLNIESHIYIEDIIGIKIQDVTEEYISSLSAPSDISVNIPLTITTGAQTSSKYTAPSNGFIRFNLEVNGDIYRDALLFINNKPVASNHSSINTFVLAFMIPIREGQLFHVYSYGTKAPISYKAEFVYSLGAAKTRGLI